MANYEQLKEKYLDKLCNTSLGEIAEHEVYSWICCDTVIEYIEIPILVLRRHMMNYCWVDQQDDGHIIAKNLRVKLLDKIVKLDDDRMVKVVKASKFKQILGIHWDIEPLDKYLTTDIMKEALKYDESNIKVQDFENININICGDSVSIRLAGNKDKESNIDAIDMTIKDDDKNVKIRYKNGEVITSANPLIYAALNKFTV